MLMVLEAIAFAIPLGAHPSFQAYKRQPKVIVKTSYLQKMKK